MQSASVAPSPPGTPFTRTTSTRTRWGLAGLAAAGCAYVAIVDPNTSSLYPQCPFKALTGYDCPGCGITRALHSFLHGNLLQAADHNLLAVLIAILAVGWLVVARVQRRRGRPTPRFSLSPRATIAIALVVLAFWVLRNLPMQPFHWLNSAA
jgi:hypothetical protein